MDRATRLVIRREIREAARRKGVWTLALGTTGVETARLSELFLLATRRSG